MRIVIGNKVRDRNIYTHSNSHDKFLLIAYAIWFWASCLSSLPSLTMPFSMCDYLNIVKLFSISQGLPE